jgi:capsular polysaccharide transport system permease protein
MLMSFLACVLAPLTAAAGYLFFVAEDQYASTVGFSVRNEEVATPIELFGGIADVASTGSSDSDILYEYIRSQEMVAQLDSRLDLVRLYTRKGDPVFAFEPSGTIEDLHGYWDRMVRVTYDTTTELIEIRALAFSPEDAQRIATSIFDESARLIDELSAIAQQDTIAFAKAELDRSVNRLKVARERLTSFRARTQIVDPSADLQGQMGVLSTLQQQLVEALITADLLRESTRESDPRIATAERRISAIEARIEDERRKLGQGGAGQDGYAELLSEFERLAVDRQFAEQAYTASLAAYDQALAEARRKSRYLAAYINPTLAEASEYPDKPVALGVSAFFLLMIWATGVLVFYSVRDRR